MGDGGRAEVIGEVERAARMLASGYGVGSFMQTTVSQLGMVQRETRGDVVSIAWRGHREESAARRIGNRTRAAALHGWTRSGGTAALPSFRRDLVGAAALAGVETVPADLLRVYALQDWPAWIRVERAIVYAIPEQHTAIAARDAIARIMWRVADVPKAERARELRMRKETYIALTCRMETILWRWLRIAATQYLAEHRRLSGVRKLLPKEPPMSASDPCGFKRETWWHPERLTPRRQQK